MKTKSAWGTANSRIYKFIRKIKNEKGTAASVCIIGASDGKFVFPFLRNNFTVTAVEFDQTALYGGEKEFPVEREKITACKYTSQKTKPQYQKIPTKLKHIDGLLKRAEKENLKNNLTIIEKDFYRSGIEMSFDIVFTSCSIQYKSNRDIPVNQIMNRLKNAVALGGYLYMDYMMPLEDSHTWKAPHFFRTGEIVKYFDQDWKIHYVIEMKQPVFEAAHVDRPEDHFHRFGYILAQRMQ